MAMDGIGPDGDAVIEDGLGPDDEVVGDTFCSTPRRVYQLKRHLTKELAREEDFLFRGLRVWDSFSVIVASPRWSIR